MKSHLTYSFLNAVLRLADAPQHTLSKVAARLSGVPQLDAGATALPDHVMLRLESVFEALSELALQPDVAAALDLACDTLQAELPTEAIAAGLYDINADEIRIVAARGLEHDLLRGTVLPRARCLAGAAAHAATITNGGAGGADWIGGGAAESTVLLCPILHDTHLLGVLALADPLCAAAFDHHDVELVGYVADQLAGFIRTQRQRTSIAPPA